MNKLLSITSAFIITFSAMAQKEYSKKVTSKYITLPSYNISEIDPASVSIEFAMKEGVFGTEKTKEAKSLCISSDATSNEIVTVTNYYYEIPYTQQDSYLVAKNTDSTFVFADKIPEAQGANFKFGWDTKMGQPLCENFLSNKLKTSFISTGDSFKAKKDSEFQRSVYQIAVEKAKANVYPSYVSEDFKVYSAKGKEFDYTSLDEAFDKAMAAYKSINKNGLNSDDIARLKESIVTWEKELNGIDLDNRKARISKSIGKGLHENCIKASLYIFDFKNAKAHINSFLELYGNLSTNRSDAVKELFFRTQQQAMASQENTIIINEVAKLHSLASSKNKEVRATQLSSSDFNRLATEYEQYITMVANEVRKNFKDDNAAAIASGEVNPYKQFYSPIAAGGPAMILFMAPSTLSGIPVLEELPKEMCVYTDLTQIVILNNSVSSITPDIAKLTVLKKLDLSGNNLKTLPPEIGLLTNLKSIKLSRNPLESIPAEIVNCTSLKTLIIKKTTLSDQAIAELERLLPNCKIKY